MTPATSYEELAIRIEAAADPGELQARLLHSPDGSNQSAPFRLPYSEQKPAEILRPLEAQIVHSGRAQSRNSRGLSLLELPESPLSTLTPQSVGQALFEALFAGTLRESLVSSLLLTESRPDTGLRIRLIFDPAVAAKVSSWPWELMYRHETRDFFSRNVATPIVRQLEVRRSALTPRPIETLRLLVVLSDPAGLPSLDVDRERELIEEALGSLPGVSLRFLETPTIEELRRRVRREPFDVLHFVGHGDLDDSGHGRVIFEDSHRQAFPISGTVLADTLKGTSRVPVVFLNACDTARLPRDAEGHDPYSGTASALVMAGISAVVAMQFPITDRAALRFSSAFYSYLAAGDPLEVAVSEGRMAIFQGQSDSWEWATPVLFLGAPEGQLFTPTTCEDPADQPQSSGPTPAPVLPRARSLEAALNLFEHQRYERALRALLRVSEATPNDPAATYYLGLARLEGRRPRAARLDVIKKLESDLAIASDLAQDEIPAHLWFLQALVKYDFYRFKGMRIRPPSIEETLLEARSAPADPTELQRLLDHIPTPPSPVIEAIAARLKDSLAR